MHMDGQITLTEASLTIADFIVPWAALLISIVFVIWFKDMATKLAKGIMFRANRNFNPGDVVLLNGDEAVIISIGITKTVFEIHKHNYVSWRYVPNDRIDFLVLEKIVKKRLFEKPKDH